jgi:hypothetical protein
MKGIGKLVKSLLEKAILGYNAANKEKKLRNGTSEEYHIRKEWKVA